MGGSGHVMRPLPPTRSSSLVAQLSFPSSCAARWSSGTAQRTQGYRQFAVSFLLSRVPAPVLVTPTSHIRRSGSRTPPPAVVPPRGVSAVPPPPVAVYGVLVLHAVAAATAERHPGEPERAEGPRHHALPAPAAGAARLSLVSAGRDLIHRPLGSRAGAGELCTVTHQAAPPFATRAREMMVLGWRPESRLTTLGSAVTVVSAPASMST